MSAIELPAAVTATAARGFAEARLAREWSERTIATVTLPWRRLDLTTGAIVSLPGSDGRWRIVRRRFEAGAVTIEAVPLPGTGIAAAADAGRATGEADLPPGATILALADLPSLGDGLADTPVLTIAAAGASPGWRRATLIGSIDGGASWETIGATAAPAVIGTVDNALPAGTAYVVDEAGTIEVTLAHDGMALEGDARLGWSATTNLALVGDELVQFGTAEAVAPRRWRLRRLLRGRRGTEWAMAGHVAGEGFLLVEPDALVAWTLPARAIGATLRIAATGAGDDLPVEAAMAFAGRALLPPDPVAVTARRRDDGIALAWTRRSRLGWTWADGDDVPLGEQAERYRVVLARGGATATIETMVPALFVPDATLAALGVGRATASVAQLGTFGPSRPSAALALPTGD